MLDFETLKPIIAGKASLDEAGADLTLAELIYNNNIIIAKVVLEKNVYVSSMSYSTVTVQLPAQPTCSTGQSPGLNKVIVQIAEPSPAAILFLKPKNVHTFGGNRFDIIAHYTHHRDRNLFKIGHSIDGERPATHTDTLVCVQLGTCMRSTDNPG